MPAGRQRYANDLTLEPVGDSLFDLHLRSGDGGETAALLNRGAYYPAAFRLNKFQTNYITCAWN